MILRGEEDKGQKLIVVLICELINDMNENTGQFVSSFSVDLVAFPLQPTSECFLQSQKHQKQPKKNTMPPFQSNIDLFTSQPRPSIHHSHEIHVLYTIMRSSQHNCLKSIAQLAQNLTLFIFFPQTTKQIQQQQNTNILPSLYQYQSIEIYFISNNNHNG